MDSQFDMGIYGEDGDDIFVSTNEPHSNFLMEDLNMENNSDYEEPDATLSTTDEGSPDLPFPPPVRASTEVPADDSKHKSLRERGQMKAWYELCQEIGLSKPPWEIEPLDVLNRAFKSVEKAQLFFKLYSGSVGFGVRKGQRRFGKDGGINVRDWVCVKEGFRRPDKDNPANMKKKKRRPKALSRAGCKVIFRVRRNKKGGVWIVTKCVTEHSHELACEEHLQFLRSNRSVSGGVLITASAMRQVGVRTSQIMSYMAVLLGGYRNVQFTPKDLYNAMKTETDVPIEDSDAAKAIGYLQHKADNDPGFFGKFSYDELGQLQNIIWVDSKCRADYRHFGHALAFDTTYKSNKYRKPLLVMVGVNHHYRTIIFAILLLKDETVESYKWALESFLECMGGISPDTVTTDGDLAMRRAIEESMPHTVHRLCLWHIQNNAVSNIKDRGFLTNLQRFMFHTFSADDFDTEWQRMVEQFGLGGNEWVQALYERREHWAENYFRGRFFANMKTTQRCEGMHWFLKSKGKSTMSLAEFVRGIDMALLWIRYNEAKDDFESLTTKPVLGGCTMSRIEEQCSQIYTHQMFYKVRQQLAKEGGYLVKEVEEVGSLTSVTLVKYTKPTSTTVVKYDSEKKSFQCECLSMATNGFPCRHIFATMKYMDMTDLPDSLIMKRWTKTAKGVRSRDEKTPVDTVVQRPIEATRFGDISWRASEIAFLGSRNDDVYRVATTELNMLAERLQSMLTMDGVEANNPPEERTNTFAVKNPVSTNTKGGGVRVGKVGSRKKKCSNCNIRGHNKKTCNKQRKRKEQREIGSDDEIPQTVDLVDESGDGIVDHRADKVDGTTASGETKVRYTESSTAGEYHCLGHQCTD